MREGQAASPAQAAAVEEGAVGAVVLDVGQAALPGARLLGGREGGGEGVCVGGEGVPPCSPPSPRALLTLRSRKCLLLYWA